MTRQITRIDGLFLGKVKTPWAGEEPSAIHKQRTSASVFLSSTGFVDDEQADLTVHGGEDKAVHHYAADHYPFWQSQFGSLPVLEPGGFGENISTLALTEAVVCIGDIFKLGAAVVQVSQGRQPCWKLNRHTDISRLAFEFQKSAKTGWYYRVLEEGHVQQGQTMQLLERPNPAWSVEKVTRVRQGKKVDIAVATALSQLPELANDWRTTFEKKAETR